MSTVYAIIVASCLTAMIVITLALAFATLWTKCLASQFRLLPKSTLAVLAVCAFCATMQAQKAQVSYVDARAEPGGDGTEGRPFRTLQEAVDGASSTNLTVMVSSGVYGPVTIPNGPAKDRENLEVCFTCTNGLYAIDGNGSGWCVRHEVVDGSAPYGKFRDCVIFGAVTGLVGGVVSDSVIANCAVGVVNGQVSYSALSNNMTCAAVDSCLTNCLVVNNGTGARGSRLINCTVADNTSPIFAGGAGVDDGCVALNTVIVNNRNAVGEEVNYGERDVFTNSCTVPIPSAGIGNVSGPACFRSGTFVPSLNSPCVDAGDTNLFSGRIDFDGLPRVQGRQIDIGAYEYGSTTNRSVTRTTPVPIPHQWFLDIFEEYYGECFAGGISYLTATYARIFILNKDLLPARIGSYTNVYYEITGNALGVVKNTGRQYTYWQEYLLGTNPLIPSDVFTANIAITNGVEITWEPNLGSERCYTIFGTCDLQEAFVEDNDYQEGTNRFFKVGVDIPYGQK